MELAVENGRPGMAGRETGAENKDSLLLWRQSISEEYHNIHTHAHCAELH